MAENEKEIDDLSMKDSNDNNQGSRNESTIDNKDIEQEKNEDLSNDINPTVKSVELNDFADTHFIDDEDGKPDGSNIDMILDISIPISVELGKTTMLLKDVLTLAPGSIVELNKLAGDTVDLMIRGKLIAKGEVVVVDDNFGMRITSICGQEERLKNLA